LRQGPGGGAADPRRAAGHHRHRGRDGVTAERALRAPHGRLEARSTPTPWR
jgi:hypothetical protein